LKIEEEKFCKKFLINLSWEIHLIEGNFGAFPGISFFAEKAPISLEKLIFK
jgi:hypothetical protein